MLHIFPHWNWTPGQTVDVWAYTNCDEVELFLNGASLGKKMKGKDDMHLMWRVEYEEGTLLGVGYRDGIEIMRQEVKTAGEPAAVILSADRSEIEADGSDLSFISVTVVDKDNIPVPHADNLVNFTVEGAGSIAGVDNGLQTSMESFRADHRKAFNGKCLLVVRAGKDEGSINVSASSDGLTPGAAVIRVR